MVQTIKAYKTLMETNPKSYKSIMGTNQTQYIEKHLKNININQSITTKQIHEF